MVMSNKEVEETIKKREKEYGGFDCNANTTRALMRVLERHPRYDKLYDVHKEALHHIFSKISRMLCGDPLKADTIVDIAGYATLMLEYATKEPNIKRELYATSFKPTGDDKIPEADIFRKKLEDIRKGTECKCKAKKCDTL